jgi:hypothetical protein
MPGRGGGTQGPSRDPCDADPTEFEPRAEKGDEGDEWCFEERKGQEIEISDTESTEVDHVERLGSRDQPTTTPGELTDLIAALKDLILQQGQTIEKIQTDLAEVKNQNGELREELKTRDGGSHFLSQQLVATILPTTICCTTEECVSRKLPSAISIVVHGPDLLLLSPEQA